jgi:hypothetical protein
MSTKASLFALLTLGAPLFLVAPPALAAGSDDTKKTDDGKTDDAKKDDAKKADDKKPDDKATAVDDQFDPFEDPSKTYRFIGIRYRDAIVPQFMIHWFANGGRNVNIPMVGPEFITRHDHLEIGISLMYADWSMSPTLFQSKTDPPTNWELVQSKLSLGYAMIDLLYEIPLEKKGDKTGRVALLIGGGVGIAGVFGQLYRAQAYPTNTANVNGPWTACQGLPSEPNAYCSPRNTPPHYAGAGGNLTTGYSEASWVNGGSKPLIYPWIALPQVSLRYKPIKQLQMKADFGFSTSGFFVGISTSYGIPTS